MRYNKDRTWNTRVDENLDKKTRELAHELGWRLPEYIRMAVENMNKRMEPDNLR
jgi:hypothetical protein